MKHNFSYSAYADSDCNYPIECHWLIEFERDRDIPGDAIEPPERGAITITARHLESAVCWVTDRGFDLKIDDWQHAERKFAETLDEELLLEAAHEWWERFGRDFDEEERSVA